MMADSSEIPPISSSQASPNKSTLEQPVQQANCYISDLTDSLLLEILIRFPTCQSAHLCKCVCKRWLHLISNHYFISCFLDHHHHVSGDLRHVAKPFTLLHQFKYLRHGIEQGETKDSTSCYKFHSISEHPVLQFRRNFDLDFLPCQGSSNQLTANIVAFDKDLLVCTSFESLGKLFYICNSVTKQCLALPPPPSRFSKGAVGFVTYSADAYCATEEDNRSKSYVNEFLYSYKLVQIIPGVKPQTGVDEFEVEIFSSDTGEWSNSLASLIPSKGYSPWKKISSNAVTYRRKLHWIINNENILVFDPFDSDKQWCLIPLPILEVGGQTPETDCLGVCQDHLCLTLLLRLDRHCLIVWDLEDYNESNWRLRHYISLEAMQTNSNNLFHGQMSSAECVLGCHPNDKAIVYLRCHNQVVECNLQDRTLKVISECIRPWFRNMKIEKDAVFSLVHPFWPSPTPPLKSFTASTSS